MLYNLTILIPLYCWNQDMDKPDSERSKVKVAVRQRPFLHSSEREEPCLRILDKQSVSIMNYRDRRESVVYSFDWCYGPDNSQQELYEEAVKPELSHVLRGQNASVFAYGPTGTGKTYTMVGTSGNPGVIPRAVGDLLHASQATAQTKLWAVCISISYLEIYQEKVRDLLDTNKQDLPIRQDRNGAILVPGLTERVVDSYAQFERIFMAASRHRMTASTQLNHTSSRSHSLLMLRVVKTEQVTPFRRFFGKLHLVDLAGSEDNRRTGNSGVRLKESGSINSSLFALSKVVDALNQGFTFVPYRESKLTRLLQDSLGGSAHTVMVTNLAPEQHFLFDSTSALNFASKSKLVVNRPLTLQSQQPVMKRRLSNNDGELGRNATLATALGAENTSLIGPLLKQQKTFQMEVWERLESIERLVSHGNVQPVGLARNALKERNQQQCQPLKCGSNLMGVQPGTAGGDSMPVGVIAPFGQPRDVHPNAFLPTAVCDSEGSVKVYEAVDSNALHFNEKQKQLVLDILNHGNVRQLKALQKVGEKRAKLIISWREEHGPFTEMEDLTKVEGLTSKVVNSFWTANVMCNM
uniref:Kinesin-like protein n=2 Tax=Eptatretus burgeri TaxID=7764 RepID=A0A8C4R657_EPTBU